MFDIFDFDLIGTKENPFLGYVSAVDRTNIDFRALVRGSKNVYRKNSNTIATRPGLKRRGSADSTAAQVDESYEWPNSLGATRVLRVANSKFQVESDIVTSGTYVWYDLQTGLSLSAYVFDTVWDNTLKKDFLVFVRGDSNLFRWDGGIGKIASTTATTIVLSATVASQGFNTTSGSVVVNGTTYAYTGSSGSTLTGVTPDPTGEAANSVVISAIITNSTTPASGFTNDFLRVNNNQVAVGSYTSRLVYISKDSSYIDFTYSTPRVPGDGELITLDSVCKGIGIRDGKFHIFGGVSELYIISFSQITVSTTLTEQTLVDKRQLANKEAALSHKFIDNAGQDLVYIDQNQQLRVIGDFRNLNQPKYPSLSLQIEDELVSEDLDGGHLKTVGELIYITAPNNGRVWVHETKTRVSSLGNVYTDRQWFPPFIWNLSRIAVIEGVEFGHSNANPQIYQLWDTLQWHDDSPSDESLAYDCNLIMAYKQRNNRTEMQKLDKVYFEGYMSPGSVVQGAVVLDYQGTNGVQTKTINDSDDSTDFFQGDVGVSLGDASLGDNPLGGLTSEEELDQELLPKFRSILGFNPVDVFEYQLRVYSESVDSRWEILCLGTNAQKSLNKPVFIQK